MDILFKEKYKDLINEAVPKKMFRSPEDRGGYLDDTDMPNIPPKYQRKRIHTENGFVSCYCEEY